MKIALLTGEYPPQPGGLGDYTRQLALALVARGHTVSVITTTAGGLQALDPQQVKLAPAAMRGAWGWRSWPALIDILDRLRPTVLHIQYQTGAYAMHPAVNLLPWRLQRLAGRPRVAVTFHDLLEPYLFPKAGALRRWVNLRLATDADQVVTTTGADARALRVAAAAWARRGLVPAVPDPAVIPIGANILPAPPKGFTPLAWRRQLGIGPDTLLIGYFGLLSRSKGVDLLLAALAELRRECSVHLLLIGGAATTPQDRTFAGAVAQQIEQLGLRRLVTQTGPVAAAVVSAHLLAVDCVGLPFRDGASFRRGSLLAALAHGCPVVTTTPQEADQLLIDGQSVVLVRPGDAGALAQAIRRLAGDLPLRRRLGVQAQRVAAHFSWPAIAARHEQLYGLQQPGGTAIMQE